MMKGKVKKAAEAEGNAANYDTKAVVRKACVSVRH